MAVGLRAWGGNTVNKGCTEKPDTVRYADTVRYRTDSRGRLTELARAVSVLLHLIRRGGGKTALASAVSPPLSLYTEV